jgi:hypothetical protein
MPLSEYSRSQAKRGWATLGMTSLDVRNHMRYLVANCPLHVGVLCPAKQPYLLVLGHELSSDRSDQVSITIAVDLLYFTVTVQ